MPKLSFDVNDSFTINSNGASITFVPGDCADAGLVAIFKHGLQIFTDAAASAAKIASEEFDPKTQPAEFNAAKLAAAQEMLDKKLTAVLAGTVRVVGERAADPVMAEFLNIVLPAVKAKYKANGFKFSGKGDDVVSASTLREKALEFGGDRDNPPSEKAAKAWAMARKRVEENTFAL